MKNYRNYLIALLTGLLVLTVTSQPSNGATNNTAAKSIEYDNCIKFYNNNIVGQGSPNMKGYPELYTFHLDMCSKYKPY
jgi:hypothetical protein